ncbi:hypothetical protein F441_04954 [Phytophthora nicotianae CJ01A1]|uniref:Uncharacterized protein n=1 Tax=Phytophthora nicotianae CJ01A1 TaxID=1317063 RepID=W2XF81_PHYNI|nr:hypothetical protein F441_04954 [Phytophthora nicotianae CJ01A1]
MDPSTGSTPGILDYYNCIFEDPDEDDAISALLATMLSRLHAKDPMSVDEFLNPPGENITAEDPTVKTFVELATKNWLQMALRPAQKTRVRTIWGVVLRRTLQLKSISRGLL